MAREERAIFTNMCMITDGNGNVLVQDRLNPDWPGITFPGGHVESGEAFTTSVIREVYEETGLVIENPVLCGTKQFQTRDGARYVVFFTRQASITESCVLLKKDGYSGSRVQNCPIRNWRRI